MPWFTRNLTLTDRFAAIDWGGYPAPKPVYTESAPRDEVMFEQLEYLIHHVRGGRHAGCPDCQRMERVARELMAMWT